MENMKNYRLVWFYELRKEWKQFPLWEWEAGKGFPTVDKISQHTYSTKRELIKFIDISEQATESMGNKEGDVILYSVPMPETSEEVLNKYLFFATTSKTIEKFEKNLRPGKTLARSNIAKKIIRYQIGQKKSYFTDGNVGHSPAKNLNYTEYEFSIPENIMLFIGFIDRKEALFSIDNFNKKELFCKSYKSKEMNVLSKNDFEREERIHYYVYKKENSKIPKILKFGNKKEPVVKFQRWIIGNKIIDYQFMPEEIELIKNSKN